MAKKLFKVIWRTLINVNQIERGPNDTFEAETTDKEIKKLVLHKYIAEV